MFSSSNIGNPFAYATETLLTDAYTIQQNPNYNSSQEDPDPPMPFHIPSPFLHNGDPSHLTHLLCQQDHHQNKVINPETTSTSNCHHPKKRNGSGTGATTDPNPNSRRKNGKKDKHTKIYTAQGLRDRRMRLSVQIAQKFFDLQDLLGFDKASKTIEWLFSKSKGEIKELTRNLHRAKHSCNISTKIRNTKTRIEDQESVHKENMEKGIEVSFGVPISENNGKFREKAAYNPHDAKESRDKARQRARERTREKMIISSIEKPRGINYDLEANPNSLDHEFPAEGVIANFLGTASSNSSTSRSIFGFQINPAVSAWEDSNNNFLGLSENWEMENTNDPCKFWCML